MNLRIASLLFALIAATLVAHRISAQVGENAAREFASEEAAARLIHKEAQARYNRDERLHKKGDASDLDLRNARLTLILTEQLVVAYELVRLLKVDVDYSQKQFDAKKFDKAHLEFVKKRLERAETILKLVTQ